MSDGYVPVIAFVVVLLAAILLFYIVSKKSTKSGLNKEWYQTQWYQIEDTFQDGKAGQMLAVVNADKLLDKAMQEKGIRGNTMGERLKASGTRFSNLNNVWSAHKLRNRIAHESSLTLDVREVQAALGNFQQALRNLGAL